jgi:hypothetical protein
MNSSPLTRDGFQRLTDGLVMIDGQMWSRAKARKMATCEVSGKPIVPGDYVYRPLGNPMNRMKRIKAEAIDPA